MSIKILGTGSSVPNRIVTNDDLAQIMDTSDEWIRSRTGIRARHLAIEETSNEMAAEAGERALLQAGMKAEELDMILVATLSPDQVMPNTACEVQKRIGAKKAVCIDLNAACSGFLFALHTAAAYIASGFSNNGGGSPRRGQRGRDRCRYGVPHPWRGRGGGAASHDHAG